MKMKNVIWRQYYWTISATVLLALLAGSGFKDTKYPPVKLVKEVVKSTYPIERVGVIARSVTFPAVLNQGQGIIDTKYPNASILCMDFANYLGSVTGLIWSMDRALVEEYGLQYLIDRANRAIFPCAAMLMPSAQGLPEQHATNQGRVDVLFANLGGAIAVSSEIKEKAPAVSMEDAKKAVLPQIEKIQEVIRFAQTVKSKQGE